MLKISLIIPSWNAELTIEDCLLSAVKAKLSPNEIIVVDDVSSDKTIDIVNKLAKTNSSFYEVGISYHGRTYEEGKKIRFSDGIVALYKIFYYKFFN